MSRRVKGTVIGERAKRETQERKKYIKLEKRE